jgi:hypothetical protein
VKPNAKSLAHAIHQFRDRAPAASQQWEPSDSTTVIDPEELGSRVRAIVAEVADAGTWGNAAFTNMLEAAVILRLISTDDIAAARRKHGVGGE